MSCLGLVKRHDRCLHSTGLSFQLYFGENVMFNVNIKNTKLLRVRANISRLITNVISETSHAYILDRNIKKA